MLGLTVHVPRLAEGCGLPDAVQCDALRVALRLEAWLARVMLSVLR